jgi:hypothetical protein
MAFRPDYGFVHRYLNDARDKIFKEITSVEGQLKAALADEVRQQLREERARFYSRLHDLTSLSKRNVDSYVRILKAIEEIKRQVVRDGRINSNLAHLNTSGRNRSVRRGLQYSHEEQGPACRLHAVMVMILNSFFGRVFNHQGSRSGVELHTLRARWVGISPPYFLNDL